MDLRKGICPVCDNDEVIAATPIEVMGQDVVPLAATHETLSWWTGGFPDPSKPYGLLYTCICRACGFTQWFAREPGKIPIDKAHGTLLIKGKRPDGPYR